MAKDSDYRNTVYCPVLDNVEKQKEALEKQIKTEAPRTKIIYREQQFTNKQRKHRKNTI